MDDSGYYIDEWPTMPDDSDFNGEDLLTLVQNDKSPFKGVWDVDLLIREIEDNLRAKVVDIPLVTKGRTSYGFHVKLSNSLNIAARLTRFDCNMPNFACDADSADIEDVEAQFEAAVYRLLNNLDTQILASQLLYARVAKQHDGPKCDIPQDISGRTLFLFVKGDGTNNVWGELSTADQNSLLAQSARIRASLFNFDPPTDFISDWFLKRLFNFKPEKFSIPVAPTREFCIELFTSKLEATIKNIGDMIGWEDDNATVGPIAAAAKQSLLRLVPHILPSDGDHSRLYRLVLEHGDFGIHNMTISLDDEGRPLITSIFDWEVGCITPAILSDPMMAVYVDLVADENAAPSITRENDTIPRAECMSWATEYFKVLYDQAPDYEYAIAAAKDARNLWFSLREWRGDDAEGYFGKLGAWAEIRLKELGVA